MAHLTERLQEVLNLAAEGLTDKEIAARLNLSPQTVMGHWKRLRSHFETSSRTEIVARVLKESRADQDQSNIDERDQLLFEIARRDRLEAELREVNEALQNTIAQREEILRETAAGYERKMAHLIQRNSYLETLNSILNKFRIIVHIAEYGASWRKLWISEGIEQSGYIRDDWTEGRVSIFDCTTPEDLPWCIKDFEPVEQGACRVICTHRFKTVDGDGRSTVDLIMVRPVDANGVGQCDVVSVEVEDWADLLKGKIAQGWPEFPLHEPQADTQK